MKCVCVCPLEWTWMLRRNCYLSCVMTSGNLPYFRENWKLAHMCRRRWCERILFRCRQPKICKKAFDTSFLFFHFLVFKWMKKSHSNVSRFATVSKLLNGYRASAENNSICKTWCASQFDGDRHSRSEWKKQNEFQMEQFVINVQQKSNPLVLAVFWCFIGTTICATGSAHRSTLIFYFISFRVCSRLDNPISTFSPHITHKHTTAISLLCNLRFNNFFTPSVCVCRRTKIKWPPPNVLNRSSMCGCIECKFTQLLKTH